MLLEIGRVFSMDATLQEMRRDFADLLAQLIKFDRATINSIDPVAGTYTCFIEAGLEAPHMPRGGTAPLEGTFTQEVSRARRGLRVQGKDVERAVAGWPVMAWLYRNGIRSFMAAPLLLKGDVAGTIALHSRTENAFTSRDMLICELVARQVSGAVSHAHLLSRARREADERSALMKIGRIVEESPDLYSTFEGVHSELGKLLRFDRIVFGIVDPANSTAAQAYVRGVPVEGLEESAVLRLKSGWEKTVAEGSQEKLTIAEHRDDGITAVGLKSFARALLFAGDRAIGIITIRSLQEDFYSDDDRRLLDRVALQIAPAIENIRLRDEARTLAERNVALARISRIINSALHIEDIYDQFASEVQMLVPWDHIAVSLADLQAGTLRDAYHAGVMEPAWWPEEERHLAGTTTEQVITENGPVLVNAASPQELHRLLPRINGETVAQAGICSALSVPLSHQGVTFGALHLRSKLPEAYTVYHAELALSVAAQVAGAVANAELVSKLEQEARERAALAEIGKIFSSTLSMESAAEPFANVLKEITPFDRLVIKRMDMAAGTMTDLVIVGLPMPGDAPGVPYQLKGTLSESVAYERRSIRLPAGPGDTTAQQLSISPEVTSAGFKSLLNVPLIFDDRVVGVLTLRSLQEAIYTAGHERFAERVASQIAGAIINFDLYTRIEQKAEEEAALAMLSRSANIIQDIDEIMARSAGIVSALVPCEHISVNLVNGDGETFHARTMKGDVFWGVEDVTRAPLKGTITKAAVRTGKTYWLSSEYERGSHPEFAAVKVLAAAGVRASITVPIIVDQAVIGTLVFISKKSNAFTRQHVSLGERIASQLSRALANAELHARTVQLAAEESLRAKLEIDNERLKVGNELKAQLLSNVSHELRTPLTSVLSFAYSLRRNPQGNLTELQLKQVDMIRRGGRILEMLISDLLTMSSMESGKFSINPEEFVLSDLITDVQAVAESIINIRGQALEVGLQTPDALVFGDRDRLSQVLFNLINNASRYSNDRTTVHLSAGVEGAELVISVRDHGIGISEAEQASLFTRFFRADNDITRSKSGTGLGLYISRSIVEMHRGSISVNSTPGVGSEFVVRIPAHDASQNLAESA